MKRPAATCSVVAVNPKVALLPNKRRAVAPKKEDALPAKCRAIAAALRDAEHLPGQVRDMLGSSLADCLGVPSEERHTYQLRVIRMVGEALAGIETMTERRIEAATHAVKDADVERASRVKARDDGASRLVEQLEAIAAAKISLADSNAAYKAAQEELAEAIAEQQEGDACLSEATAKKEELESALNNTYMPLKGGSLDVSETQACLARLNSLGNECEFDLALITSLPAALNKPAETRGVFDAMVLEQAENELQQRIAAQADVLARGEPQRQEQAAKVLAARALVDAAREHEQQTCRIELINAQMAHKETEAELQTLVKAVKQFSAEMEEVTARLETLKTELNDLRSGPIAIFKELEVWTSSPPSSASEAGLAAAPAVDEDMSTAEVAEEGSTQLAAESMA